MKQTRALRAYADVVLGRQRSPENDTGPFMVPYLRAANVKDGELDLSDVKSMNFSPREQAAFSLERGDVLVTEGSGSLTSVGASAFWNADLPGTVCFQNTLLRLRPRPGTDPRFLAWWCRYAFVDGLFASIATGANIFHVSAERLRSLPMTYLPLRLQQQIADYLDRETARIDALIAAKQRMVELLEERWRSTVERTMTALIDERGAIPLRHLVTCLDGRRVPVSAEERASRQGDYPYYGASGIVDQIDNWLFDEELVLLGEDGAQLGDPTYPIAQVVHGKIWVNNHAHVLRPRAVDAQFLSLHLNTFDRIQFMSGGTREKITQNDMNRIPVPHLTTEEQHRVGLQLSRVRAHSESMASTLTRQINLLKERRQALITAAVTGQFDIPEAA